MMDVLVQLHYLEQIVLKILELLPVTLDYPFLRTDHSLQLLDSTVVLLDSPVKFHTMSLRLDLLVDSLLLLITSFTLYFFYHLPQMLIFVEDILQGTLRLTRGVGLLNAASWVFSQDHATVRLGRAHLLISPLN